jgi:FtsZ-binding cell division protein ZapB
MTDDENAPVQWQDIVKKLKAERDALKQTVEALLGTMDADAWAAEFCEIWPPPCHEYRVDIWHDIMRGWFANAIMCGYDHAARERDNIKAEYLEQAEALMGLGSALKKAEAERDALEAENARLRKELDNWLARKGHEATYEGGAK